MVNDKLVRKFKDEAVAVYEIENNTMPKVDIDFKKYVVSTRCTRDLMNYPEIINCDFTNLMVNGLTNALKGINLLERLSCINSKTVNVYHILRGGLNFEVRNALKKAFGYKWHSSSYLSSQRVLKEGKFEISENYYRKFILPDEATVYTADIIASGGSLNNGIEYLYKYVKNRNSKLKNMVFITIGCVEAEKILEKWHNTLKENFPDYEKTILIYLEGRFGLANDNTKLYNSLPETDLLKSFKDDALITPEFEHSQFEKMIIGLEACVIYDGGKKGFEPVNHIKDIIEFWEKQHKTAIEKELTLWEEYNNRFPLDMYFENINSALKGNFDKLIKNKNDYWTGISEEEYKKLFYKFLWLWSDERIVSAKKPGSFVKVCEKKLDYLKSLIFHTE
jgi:hypothetical protein